MDAHGDTRVQTSPDTGVTNAAYTQAGDLDTRTDAVGQTLYHEQDALNRLDRVATAGASVYSHTYDSGLLGQLYSLGRRTVTSVNSVDSKRYWYDRRRG